MKKYYMPELQIIEVKTTDVLSVSNGGTLDNWNGGVVEDYGSLNK